MFGKVGKLIKNTTMQSGAATPDIAAQSKAAFSKNLSELQKFTSTELPNIVSSQQAAWAALEQSAKNARAMIK